MRSPRLCVAMITCLLTFGLFPAVADAQGKPGKVKVFILAGQSNMEGKGTMKLAEYQSEAPRFKDFYQHLKKDGKWIVRDDVWINFLDRRGNLTVGFGSPDRIGPELEFGIVVGDYFKEPVLLIKTAWGGQSLGRDFLPPGSPKSLGRRTPHDRGQGERDRIASENGPKSRSRRSRTATASLIAR